MADFAPWLRNNAVVDPALTALRDFAQANAAAWPYQSNKVEDYVQAIDNAAPANASALKLGLYRYFVQWLAHAATTAGERRFPLGSVAMVLAGLVIAGFLMYGIFSQKFLGTIANMDNARGLVTFLFAFATTSVIVVVTIGVLWVPKDEIEARFSKAKDIMTILISVLGTILGFYFGSVNQNPTPAAPDKNVAGQSAPQVPAPAPAPEPAAKPG